MTDTSRLRIVGRRVELDAELAQSLIARGITQLAVDSDQVRVCGEFTLPGGSVHIRCRKLDGVEPVIDVSARTPPPPWSEAKAPNGTARKLDGQAGQDGVTGMHGGSIHIACQRIASPPRLLACGSPGGDSQGGGNGLKPTTPSANEAKFNKDKTGGTYGGKVLKKFGLSYFLSVAYGQKGHDGGKGGDGGPPGMPGRGGNGGSIEVALGEISPAIDARVEPGAPGVSGASGKGAGGGAAGPGGLHRLYRYEWLKKTFEVRMNSRRAEVAEARRTYKLSQRAGSGRAGAKGKDSKVQPKAEAGAPGIARCQSATPADLAANFDADYLRKVTAWAEQALECTETEPATTIARWALTLLDAGAAADEATTLRQMLEQLLSRIKPSPLEVKSLTS